MPGVLKIPYMAIDANGYYKKLLSFYISPNYIAPNRD